MTYLGIDTAARITADQAKKLRENGVSFVGRYLVPADNPKALTATEAAILRNAGLALLLCWELDAEAVKCGAQRGVSDGVRARQCAEALGVPSGTTIYFAADYNVPQSDLIQAEQYILSAQIAMSGKYNVGIYGGEKVCGFLFSRGTTRKVWQCVAWTNQFIDGCSVRQYAWQGAAESKDMAAKTGILAVDMDSTEDMRGAGMWMPYNEYADGDGTIIETPAPSSGPSDHLPSEGEGKPWYADDMDWMERNGLMMDGRPNDAVTRAELAAVVHRLEERRFSGLLED